ncbi:MAG: undecaprenyl-diphosphate phosphatase [Thermoanaerobaculia bacterium]
MTGSQALVLGLVQGVTEFLPISSSAHLILTSYFLAWRDQGLYFDIAVHVGSMLAVILFLRKDVGTMLSSFRARSTPAGDDEVSHLGTALLVGTVPVALGGLFLRGFVETTGRQPLLIATTSIVYGVALLIADRKGAKSRRLREVGWKDGLLVGLGQALALIPGTSRAGITMTVALALGYGRAAAARFSFLLAIPVSLLVAIGQLVELNAAGGNGVVVSDLAIGFLASGVAAFLAIGFLINWVKRQDYSLFVAYRVVLGLMILVSLWR